MARRQQAPTRPARGEDGYAMVVTVLIVMILTMLLTVVLAQGLHNNTATTRGYRRAQALGVAEAGVNWAIAALQADKATAVVTNQAVPVADGTGGNGTATVTVRAGTPDNPGKLGSYTVYSTGQPAQPGAPTRTVRVVLGAAPSFLYALYADSSLTLEQNACIVGPVFSKGDVYFNHNSTIAGTSKTRGSLISQNGVIKQFSGGNNAKCPSAVDGEPVDASRDIHGDVLAGGGTLSPCLEAPAGAVDSAAEGYNLNGATVGGRVCNTPPPYNMPAYTFDPLLYASIQYYGQPPGYGSPSLTAVTQFNTAFATGTLPVGAGGGLDRTYVVWEDLSLYTATNTTPPALKLDASTLPIAKDTVIYTNVPVDFGNTTTVSAAQSCSTASPPPSGTPACPTFQVISAYPGNPCTGGVGNCPSIYGGNKIQFRPEVAVLLYSQDGTVVLKNDCNAPGCDDSNNGAIYASSINGKNNLNVSYTPRIASALGFGKAALLQQSWEELAPCPPGQTPPC